MNEPLHPGQFELVNRLAILSAARVVEWRDDGIFDESVPSSINDGADVADSPVTLVHLACRRSLNTHTVHISVDVVTDTAYNLMIATYPVSYNASPSDTETDILEGVRDAINNDQDAGQVVNADLYDSDGDGTQDVVRLRGDGTEAHYTSSVDPSLLSQSPDSTDLRAILYGYNADTGPSPPDRWAWLGSDYHIGYRGHGRIIVPTQNLNRLAVEVEADGWYAARIGPAKLEG